MSKLIKTRANVARLGLLASLIIFGGGAFLRVADAADGLVGSDDNDPKREFYENNIKLFSDPARAEIFELVFHDPESLGVSSFKEMIEVAKGFSSRKDVDLAEFQRWVAQYGQDPARRAEGGKTGWIKAEGGENKELASKVFGGNSIGLIQEPVVMGGSVSVVFVRQRMDEDTFTYEQVEHLIPNLMQEVDRGRGLTLDQEGETTGGTEENAPQDDSLTETE